MEPGVSLSLYRINYFRLRRLAKPKRPTNPKPSMSMAAGSGTARDALNEVDPGPLCLISDTIVNE